MTTVGMQIAYKQMTARVQALGKLFKALNRYNDSESLGALDAAVQPAKVLEKFLKATPCVPKTGVELGIPTSQGSTWVVSKLLRYGGRRNLSLTTSDEKS